MAHKEFYIYTDRNKLQTFSTTEYRVEKLSKPKDLKPFIRGCKEEIICEGVQFVLKNFDKLFSLIEFIDQIDYLDLHDIYDEVLVKSLNFIGSYFISFENIADIESDFQHKLRNVIKMNVYLFVEFVHSYNAKIETDNKLLLLESKGRSKKQDNMIQRHISDHGWNWEEKLSHGFKAINSIIIHNITQLYDPAYVDHTFVSYIASCCYTLLENPSITLVRNKLLRESIMEILLVLITNYSHAENFKIKVVELLKLYEHLSLPMAKIVIRQVESGKKRSSLIELIVKEIVEQGEMEGIKKESSNQEITGGKSCCAFLVEIAKQHPQLVLPNIDHLLPCLESDPYTMRICVLSVLKELIIQVLSNEDLDELGQQTRDNYLSILQDHLLDINAFVRSKTLHLFIAIINENCLPKKNYNTILNLAEERLHDKSSYVTKSAIQLIKTIIKLNPYGCDFTENNLQDRIEENKCILQNLNDVLEAKLKVRHNNEGIWLSIESPLKLFFEETFEDKSFDIHGAPQDLKNLELPDVLFKIKCFITLNKFKSAIKLVLYGKKTYKDEPLFQLKDKVDLSEQLFLLLKNIWWSKRATRPEKSNNTEEFELLTAEEISLKIYSIESMILYLQECVDLSDIIKRSLNTIHQLMFENTTSESLEAIEFFTTAHLFGIPNTQAGIDSMLTLMYSSETSIKDAMMNAYKTIYLNVEEINDSTKKTQTIMTRIINIIKTLNVTNRKAFKVLLNEWMKNKTLNDDCIMLLWAWFTKTVEIAHEDRIIATVLISMLTSAKPCIAKGNLENLIQYGLADDYQLFIYTCQILEQIPIFSPDFQRYNGTHEIVNRILNITQKCFYEGNVQMFNDVALNAVNIIYQLTTKPDRTCMLLIRKLFKDMKINNKHLSEQNEESIEMEINLFAQFNFIIGQIALQHHDFLENYVSKDLIQIVKSKYQTRKLQSNQTNNDENDHDSEAAEVEAINNQILRICDKQLVTGRSGILSLVSNDVLKACNSNNSTLKATSVITLIKFMMVSSTFCKTNLQLFINLIENLNDLYSSINLISGFGWLIFRHPNLLEPYTDKLFSRLKDETNIIRYSALVTIINLIYQEMIKVRGQISGIAKLLVDKDEKIRSTAKYFFGIIAGKGNTLYNVLTDIISTLSNPEDLMPENDFQEIMKFILPLVNKERQIEAIVDQLCKRLKESNNHMQAYYLSYCLMFIKYSDKSLVKLLDNISCYSEKLLNPRVYNNFNVLISSNSRMAKPSTKDILSELTFKIERVVNHETDGSFFQKTPGKHLNEAKNKLSKSTVKKNTCNEIEPLQLITKQSARIHTKVKRKLINDSEGEENNDESIHTSVVSNKEKVKNTIDCEFDGSKQSTRQKTSENKKKLRSEL